MSAQTQPYIRAWRVGVLSTVASLLFFIPTAPALSETLLKAEGMLSEANDSRLEDGSLYDAHKFAGDSGQQVTIVLESRDFDPYLILLDPDGERLDENDDISRNNLNSRLVVVLPSTGTYTIYANSYDATKSGEYDIIVRTNDRSMLPANLPANLSALLLEPSEQCSATLSAVIQSMETGRDVRVLPSLLQLIDRYTSVPEGKPDGVEIGLSGTATPSVMASSQLIKYVASRLIESCTSVGAVAFKPESYAEERVFGYSPAKAFEAPAENPVEEFNCTAPADSRFESRSPWGQKHCS